MKKFLFVLLSLLFCLVFSASAEEATEPEECTQIVFFSEVPVEQQEEVPNGEFAADDALNGIIDTDDDFAITYGDTRFQLGDNPTEILAEMDKEDHPAYVTIENRHTVCNEANCSYESDELAVMTDPDDETGDEVITAVFVDVEGVKTNRQIGIGDHIRKVYLKYGHDYQTHSDLIVYKVKDKEHKEHFLLFQIDDNKVFSYAFLDEPPYWYKHK